MAIQLTEDDARESLGAHAASRGFELRRKYGPDIGWNELKRILQDRTCVRYPCELAFDSAPLEPGEFACPIPKGAVPDEGFVIAVHPHFSMRLEEVAWLVLYQLVAVNYGDFAAPEDAEAFGAAALGIPPQEYYEFICARADEVSGG